MLNEESYQMAMIAYIASAVLALLLTAWWLRKSWRPAWIGFVVLVGGALLLTPAYPEAGINTMAPALVVAAFQWVTIDQSAAEHALRPLAYMVGGAAVLSLLLGLTILRYRSKVHAKARPKPKPRPGVKTTA
ncbi:MAG: hypothetical protein ACK5ME_13970 [Parahaliea sp.]